jgi:hypothetical protein
MAWVQVCRIDRRDTARLLFAGNGFRAVTSASALRYRGCSEPHAWATTRRCRGNPIYPCRSHRNQRRASARASRASRRYRTSNRRDRVCLTRSARCHSPLRSPQAACMWVTSAPGGLVAYNLRGLVGKERPEGRRLLAASLGAATIPVVPEHLRRPAIQGTGAGKPEDDLRRSAGPDIRRSARMIRLTRQPVAPPRQAPPRGAAMRGRRER